mgnify:CR=1 FL=1
MAENETPDALLLITPGCPHCPKVLEGLSTLVKEGVVGRLEVVNVASHPETAAELGVRTAPWTRLGPFELAGAQSAEDLRRWAELAGSEAGWTAYARELLANGQLDRAEALAQEEPGFVPALLPLVEDTEAPMQVRVGVGAVLEGLAGSETLRALRPRLEALAGHDDHRVRADACHLLGLTGDPAAAETLRARLADDNAEVREIAGEALEELEGS